MKISVRKVLLEAASFYKENFRYLAVTSLLLCVLFAIPSVAIAPNMVITQGALIWLFIGLEWAWIVLIIIFMPKFFLAIEIIINSSLDENRMTLGEAYRRTKGKNGNFWGRSILVALMGAVPYVVILLLKIPFAYIIGPVYMAFIASLYYMVVPMIALEPKTTRYLRKSAKMIKGNYLMILLLYFITATLLALLTGIVTHIFTGDAIALLITNIVHYLIYFFVLPFSETVRVMVYRHLPKAEPDIVESGNTHSDIQFAYCRNCGAQIDRNAYICLHCGASVQAVRQRRKFYSAGFVLGILSLCIPIYGLILGIIGLPLACISKRKSAIILNIIGVAVYLVFILFLILGYT